MRLFIFSLLLITNLGFANEPDQQINRLENEINTAGNSTELKGQALVELVKYCWYRCRDKAKEYGEQALTHFQQYPNIESEVLLAGFLPRVYLDTGEYEKAQSIIGIVIDKGPLVENQNDWARVLSNQAILYKKTGQYLLAEEGYLKALEIYRSVENRPATGNIYNNLALVSHSQGDLGSTLKYYNLSLPLLEKHGSASNHAMTLSNIATVYEELGDESATFLYQGRAEKLIQGSQDKHRLVEFITRRSAMELTFNYLKKAEQSANQALSKALEIDSFHNQAVIYLVLGKIALKRENFFEAENNLAKSFDMSFAIKSDSLLNQSRLLMATIASEKGDVARAYELLNPTISVARQLGQNDVLSKANRLMVEVLKKQGNLEKALDTQRQYIDQYVQQSENNKTNNLEQLAVLFKQKEQQQKITELERDNAQQALQVNIERQTNQRLLFFAILVAAALFFALIYLLQRRRLSNLRANMAQQLVERKNKMLSDISHELRTPIAAIKLQLEMLEYELTETPKETYKTIHNKIGSLNRLINDVFQLSQMDAGELDMRPQKIEIKAYLEGWVNSNADLVHNCGLNFGSRIDINDKVNCECDVDRLNQILSNLLANSCRYTDRPGGVHLYALVRDTDLVCYVEDSGPGLNESQIEQLFERLYRADTSRSRDSGGAGLGLSICQALVEAHGGKIKASQSMLGGLEIKFTIPLRCAKGGKE